jgi:hypothetical protein
MEVEEDSTIGMPCSRTIVTGMVEVLGEMSGLPVDHRFWIATTERDMHRGLGDDDTFWKKVGEEVVMTAVNTLVEEGIEATVEIWKKRRLKIQEDELEKDDGGESSSESSEAAAAGERKRYPGGGADDGDEDKDDGQESAAFGGASPVESAGASVDSFSSYVAGQDE